MGRLYNKRDGVEVKIVETGEVFSSMQSCAEHLGVNPTWLAKVVRGETGYCTCRGYHIIRTDGLYATVDTTKLEHRGRPGIRVYSERFFGTADAISFRNNVLRIHDLKTGKGPVHMEQLEVYA